MDIAILVAGYVAALIWGGLMVHVALLHNPQDVFTDDLWALVPIFLSWINVILAPFALLAGVVACFRRRCPSGATVWMLVTGGMAALLAGGIYTLMAFLQGDFIGWLPRFFALANVVFAPFVLRAGVVAGFRWLRRGGSRVFR